MCANLCGLFYVWVCVCVGFVMCGVKKEFLFHRPVLIFQPTENSRASNNQSTQCQKRIRSFTKNAQLLSDGTYIGVCEGV